MKRFLTLLFFFLLACNGSEEQGIPDAESKPTFSTSLNKAEEILFHQESIIQYLDKAHLNIRIFPCEFKEDRNYYYFRFILLDTPVHLNVDYKIIPYKNSYVLLVKNEPLDHQIQKDSLTLKLVHDSLIIFEPETKMHCEVPYVNFIVCKNDITKVGYYDIDMINDSLRNDVYKQIKEESFYPNCH